MIEFNNELHRVLKPNGILMIAFIAKEYLEQLSFVDDVFTLYNNEKLEKIFFLSKFVLLEFIDKTEEITDQNNNIVQRNYCMAKLLKK